MELFEDFDNPEKANQKLSFKEKMIIQGLVALAKVGLWKVKRAKTYGDINKIVTFLDDKFEEIEDDKLTEENAEKSAKQLDEIAEGLTKI